MTLMTPMAGMTTVTVVGSNKSTIFQALKSIAEVERGGIVSLHISVCITHNFFAPRRGNPILPPRKKGNNRSHK